MKRSPIPKAALYLAFIVASARAEVKLPALFSDHMVVQADTSVPVWGWAGPGEDVTVSLAGQSKTTKAGTDGKWKVTLEKLKASNQPQTLTVKGMNTRTAKDVLVGEVWLGSGQSNMAYKVASSNVALQTLAEAKAQAAAVREGDKVRLRLKYADGLRARDGAVRGFALQDESGGWSWAEGKVDGTDLLVWSAQAPRPQALRYAWAENPIISIENGAGLPLRPFRIALKQEN